MDGEILFKYANVILKAGIQLKKGQNLFITAPTNAQNFVRVLTLLAYRDYSARYVKVFYKDDLMNVYRANACKEEFLDYSPKWEEEYMGAYSEVDCAAIELISGEETADDIASAKSFGKVLKAEEKMKRRYWENVDKKRVSWTIAAYPSLGWAKNVYPEMDDKSAYNALCQDFVKIYKLNTDNPVLQWEKHRDFLCELRKKLNELSIKALHLLSPTVDLHMELCKGTWRGGSAETFDKKTSFMGNLPTYEVFHVPKVESVNGFVKSTMPLNYNGKIIRDIELTFKEGKVISYNASENFDILKVLLNVDEGASRLGEVGLVTVNSEIFKTGRVFYTTLFDENAVTHLALGAGCESVIDQNVALSDEEAKKIGVNRSSIHVDFMVGSLMLSVYATLEDGREIKLMENGEYVI